MSWTAHVQAPPPRRPADRPPVAPAVARPPKRRRVPWLRIAALLIAATFAVVAVVKGQDIEWVGLNGEVHFYNSQGASGADPNAELQLEQRRTDLQEQVENSESTTAEDVVDLSGSWYSDDPSFTYAAVQSGSDVVLAESQGGDLTALCYGTFERQVFTFTIEAVDDSVGRGTFELMSDGSLSGHVTTPSGSGTMTLTRSPR